MYSAKHVLFCGVLLIGVGCGKMCVEAQKRERPTPLPAPIAKPPQPPASPMQVAEALDAYVQPRFEMLDNKHFGMTRIILPKHANVVYLRMDTPEEKEWIARVNAAKHDYAIQLLHCAPIPMRSANRVTPALQPLYFEPQPNAREQAIRTPLQWAEKIGLNRKAIESKAVTVLPQLMAGKEQRTEEGSWDVLMRPVRATKPACVGCHTDAKLGATLGVMVYAVRKTTAMKPQRR